MFSHHGVCTSRVRSLRHITREVPCGASTSKHGFTSRVWDQISIVNPENEHWGGEDDPSIGTGTIGGIDGAHNFVKFRVSSGRWWSPNCHRKMMISQLSLCSLLFLFFWTGSIDCTACCLCLRCNSIFAQEFAWTSCLLDLQKAKNVGLQTSRSFTNGRHETEPLQEDPRRRPRLLFLQEKRPGAALQRF